MNRFALWVLVAIVGSLTSQGSALAQQGDRDQAVHAFESGRSAMQRKEWSAALAHFDRAAGHPDVAAAARLHIALVREEMGQADQAATDYLATLDMKHVPGFVQAAVFDRLLALGWQRARSADLAGAEVLLKRAASSGRIDALQVYGEVLLQQRKWTEVEQVAARLQEKDPYGAGGWWLLFQAQKANADAALADPARAADREKLMKKAQASSERIDTIPFFLKDIKLVQANNTHVVRATMLGNAAPAGSWCIIDFSLDMGNKSWRAPVVVTAPAREQMLEIEAQPATTDRFPTPPQSSEVVFSVGYSLPYCELPGVAAQTPLAATKARLKRCPESEYEANELVTEREPLGSLPGEYKKWEEEHSFPAGGIELFGEQITRLTGKEETSRDLTIFYFGLPGQPADYVRHFTRAYRDKNPSCRASGYCATELDETKERGVLFSATLERVGPTRMLPEGTYLRCHYR